MGHTGKRHRIETKLAEMPAIFAFGKLEPDLLDPAIDRVRMR